MSTPDSLYVYRVNNNLKEVMLGKRAAGDLFDYLLPKLESAAPTFKDQFEGEYYGEVLSITALPQQYFPAVYNLIMSACDKSWNH